MNKSVKSKKEATRSVAGQFPGDDRSYRVWPALRFAKGIRLVCGCAKDVLGLHLVAMGFCMDADDILGCLAFW